MDYLNIKFDYHATEQYRKNMNINVIVLIVGIIIELSE